MTHFSSDDLLIEYEPICENKTIPMMEGIGLDVGCGLVPYMSNNVNWSLYLHEGVDYREYCINKNTTKPFTGKVEVKDKKFTTYSEYLNGYKIKETQWDNKFNFISKDVNLKEGFRHGSSIFRDYNFTYTFYHENGVLIEENQFNIGLNSGKVTGLTSHKIGKDHVKYDGNGEITFYLNHSKKTHDFIYLNSTDTTTLHKSNFSKHETKRVYFKNKDKNVKEELIYSKSELKYYKSYHSSGVVDKEIWCDGVISTTLSDKSFIERIIKNGPCTEYYSNGEIKSFDEFVFDKKHGKSQRWNEKGVMLKDELYNNGDLIKSVKYWDSGKIRSVEEFFKMNEFDLFNVQNVLNKVDPKIEYKITNNLCFGYIPVSTVEHIPKTTEEWRVYKIFEEHYYNPHRYSISTNKHRVYFININNHVIPTSDYQETVVYYDKDGKEIDRTEEEQLNQGFIND